MVISLNKNSIKPRVLQSLTICSALGVFLYLLGGIIYQSWAAWYLVVNLGLAAIPLALTYPLLSFIERYGLWDGRTVIWAVVWLVFLPNSFYLVTDVMHVSDTHHGYDLLFAAIMFGLFAFIGMALGFVSLYAVHQALLRRLSRTTSYLAVMAILLITSVAIYLGKVLRWNSWDVVLHPVRVASDIAGLVLHVSQPGTMVVATFFVLLAWLYAAIWRAWGTVKA
jgi:uncharacterized membrane protein